MYESCYGPTRMKMAECTWLGAAFALVDRSRRHLLYNLQRWQSVICWSMSGSLLNLGPVTQWLPCILPSRLSCIANRQKIQFFMQKWIVHLLLINQIYNINRKPLMPKGWKSADQQNGDWLVVFHAIWQTVQRKTASEYNIHQFWQNHL